MSNDHLIPVVIQDLGNELLVGKNTSFTRDNIVQRLEAIRDYCDRTLQKYSKQKP